MHPLLLLSFALQFLCAVHVIRTGRPYYWIFILVIGSFIGVALYVATQILPDFWQDPRTRRAARGALKTIDPSRDLRRLEAELEVAGTVQNKLKLGQECLELGHAARAEEVFRDCLKGVHQHDPDILLALARAEFEQAKYAEASSTLDLLMAHNPDFRSPDGHLLYARSLEGQGEHELALKEYAVLDESYPGEEARSRHAELLQRLGRIDEARELWQQTLARAKVAPAYYRRAQAVWIDRAKAALKQAGAAQAPS